MLCSTAGLLRISFVLLNGDASCDSFTFPANSEVLHYTLPIFIQHLSQLFHGWDGVVAYTAKNYT